MLQPGACCAYFDIRNIYLDTPLEDPDYVRIKHTDIQQEFIDEYDLAKYVWHGWIYFAIIRFVYELKQCGKLSKKLVRSTQGRGLL